MTIDKVNIDGTIIEYEAGPGGPLPTQTEYPRSGMIDGARSSLSLSLSGLQLPDRSRSNERTGDGTFKKIAFFTAETIVSVGISALCGHSLTGSQCL
jgi:hypothetical protein